MTPRIPKQETRWLWSEAEPLLRAELFGADQMELHGQFLANQHKVRSQKSPERLLRRLEDNQQVLVANSQLLIQAVKAKTRITPAGEWLLDNFYLISEQIRIARVHLPRNYSRELPCLISGDSTGLPRVYDIALQAVAHGDGRIDGETLSRFVASYQTVAPLTLGELWAIPIMLRLALIENLRRVSLYVTRARTLVNLAQDWATRMIAVAENDPKSLILVIADMARSNPPLVSAFVAELVRRLQGHGTALALPLNWMEQRLAEESLTTEMLIAAENQQQAMDQVSISNSIGSLRFLGAFDWRVFVETMSLVEQQLRREPGGIYPTMDFATRDSYRQVIDRLAKRSTLTELQIADAALDLARHCPDLSSREAHVGYYLVDNGLPRLEQAVAAQIPLTARLRRQCKRAPLMLYQGGALLSVFAIASGLSAMLSTAPISTELRTLIVALAALAATVPTTTLINWIATLLVKPRRLPRLDYENGIPRDRATMVVVPCLLTSILGIDELLEALEVRFLGNRDQNLYFALLTDLTDATTETTENDEPLLKRAREGIEQLNAKYPGDTQENLRFLLLHRPRLWNAKARLWMGYERKRGKLAALNSALRGGDLAAFTTVVGSFGTLPPIRYVITLDTDTQLPRDAARQFIAVMAHPLNQPRYAAADAAPGTPPIVAGYSILQPRMAASLAGARRSRYVQLHGTEPGIDPYTLSVSDVYQDLFGEGSFIGKGIYDVDAFEHSLKGQFPDNRILSHDLLEGCYARSGLLSDVHLYEEPPARYDTDVGRRERWIRGDWQIARWLLPRVPAADGSRTNPLSALSRWKIADNLVRSLVPAALLLLLLMGWYLPGLEPLVWTLAVLGLLLIPPVLIAVVDAVRKPQDVELMQHLTLTAVSAGRHMAQAVFRITVLPYEAVFSLEAIVRSLWRLWFAPRFLLQWNASAELEQRLPASLPAYVRRMWVAPAIAAITALGLMLFEPAALVIAAPVLTLWFLAPLTGWWISQPLVRPPVALNVEQTVFLRKIARKTWAFFARFVSAEDNWLPPDNFQENPGPVIAHRTSPTNMGMALLANLSAWDLGFISASETLQRTRNTLGSMAGLERHRGHFFNWYDTRTRQPLPPRYISSVDSGNLAGHLLTLRTGLQALPDQWLNPGRVLSGLQTTLAILSDSVQLAQAAGTSPEQTLEAVQISVARLNAQLGAEAGSLEQLHAQLERVAEMAQDLHSRLITHAMPTAVEPTTLELINKKPRRDDDLHFWAEALLSQSRTQLAELQHLLPWLGGGAPPPDLTELQEQLISVAAAAIPPSLTQLRAHYQAMLLAIETPRQPMQMTQGTQALDSKHEALRVEWLTQLRSQIASAATWVDDQLARCTELAEQASAMAFMEFDFLYDRTRHLLAVGYNLDDFRRDNSFYDLLASEARLGTFVAIAQGQLPQESWFALGRLRASTGGDPVLVSWSGSMFEYLMPMLVMPTYDGTLLDQTCRAAVSRQIAYGKQLGLPWGVSESGYYTFDTSLNYQYHAFGVPGLGFKRGLAEDVVIAPYASALALMVAPDPACTNMQRLAAMGLEGRFGLYEAVDYTPARLARGATHAVVQSYMAHHQGMSLLAIAHVLVDQPMQRRFAMEPLLRATLMLLQERIPKAAVLHKHIEEDEGSVLFDGAEASVHAPIPAETPTPEVHLLSNGRYHVMVTNAGGGYSRCRDLAVTRWREDTTRDHWGMFVYLRDSTSGDFWSACHQPTLKRADTYSAIFSEGRAEYRRRDRDIETYTDLVVSPEDNIELRRLRITNRSAETRTLEITSYGEVVLAAPAADDTQSAFSNLFVQTEILPERHAVLCTRRPRSETEQPPWMFHLLASNGTVLDAVSYETDRLKFIGRGRTLVAPQTVAEGQELSGSQGSVLDPIVAIRVRVTLAPGQVVRLDLITGMADNRAACLTLVGRYQDRHFADRVFELAATHSGVTLRQLNASEADARLYRRLAGTIIYGQAALRADPGLILQNRRGQSGLWGYAISGDLPIVLLKIASTAHIELARQLIQCHAYWRLKGLAVDLVIWNEDHVGYRQRLQDQILGLIATGSESHAMDRPGGIFVRSAEQISQEDRILLQSVARAIIDAGEGSLAEQIQRRPRSVKKVARLTPTRPFVASTPPRPHARAGLILSNPLGGFTPDGREYIVTTSPDQTTPLPWVNVLANSGFGSVISESGSAYTWSENAHEFRLTPWSSDQVGAAGGEALYVRDEETGHFWSPTPLPRSGQGTYVTRHGFGYSVFKHTEDGIETELCVYVDLYEAVKFSVLKIRNQSGRRRQLSATGYVEWVLGDLRTKSALHLVTEIDAASGALFARNAYNTEFAGRTCFFDVDDNARSLTGDRAEFLGRNGSLANPDAMHRVRLSGRLGAALDPCGAIMVPVDLVDGQERQIIFRLGAGRDYEQARALAQRLRQLGTARNALAQVHDYWTRTLGTVRVKTPDPAFDVLANGWLVYQTLACRLWARSGFYQSGGAYGFRDQLQDSMALAHSEPGLMRAQLLRAAQRQYHEGDVQHWWHPPHGRGVRTRCSDDYLWLPLVLCHYVKNTGDHTILDEQLPFLTGRMLNAEEESYYDLPGQSSDVASLYQHAVRAIKHGLRFGERGLPLMGSGDWNDGMNLVGIHGKGESVWLGFMLYKVLRDFAALAHPYGDAEFAESCLAEAAQLQINLEQHAWDGDWYRRAWFDDGVALGSAVNDECRIDSIAQSWSVLSGAGEPARSRRAMAALDQHLVRRDHGIIQLLDPPFDRSSMNPGYIKGYVPGVRENGGQYTHSAIWAAMAFAELGDNQRAWELFNIINPVNHGQSGEAIAVYKAEPYVVAADVYAIAPHTGRGGWSWYTGSAGWLYRLMLESLLGVTRLGDHLQIKPCLPAGWPGCTIDYRFGETLYRIDIQQQSEGTALEGISLDGEKITGDTIPLTDDGKDHQVKVRKGLR